MPRNIVPQSRAEQLADAYYALAHINHYMVGIVESVTWKEREAAEQILISRQNALPRQAGRVYKRLDLALDLIEMERQADYARASHGKAMSVREG